MGEEPKKLTEERLKDYKAIFTDVMHGQLSSTSEVMADKGLDLLDHIAAMEAEQRAGASRTASDAFEVGHANANFIERQTLRIQELEQANAYFKLIQAEMDRQDAKWGDQTGHSALRWSAILMEEVGEVCKAVLEKKPVECSLEFVQVAAVAVQFMRAIAVQQGVNHDGNQI